MDYVLAFLSYLMPTFPLGYVWHLKTFKSDYHALGLYRDEVIIPMGLGSMVVQGIFFAWAYPRLFGGLSPVAGALAFFAVFAPLAWSFVVLPVAAKYKMTSVRRFMTLETAFTALQFAITAPLIAWAHSG